MHISTLETNKFFGYKLFGRQNSLRQLCPTKGALTLTSSCPENVGLCDVPGLKSYGILHKIFFLPFPIKTFNFIFFALLSGIFFSDAKLCVTEFKTGEIQLCKWDIQNLNSSFLQCLLFLQVIYMIAWIAEILKEDYFEHFPHLSYGSIQFYGWLGQCLWRMILAY